MSSTGIVVPYWADVKKDDLTYFSKLAEDLGYHSIWVPEMWGRDAFSLISHMASVTEKIKLATGIISVYSRSPALIAQSAATMDEYCGGRLILGLGISSVYLNEYWHGTKFERPIRRTLECVEIIRTIIAGKRVDYDGEIFRLRNFRLLFEPLRSEIPIYIASMGPKNIELTSRIADGWIPYLCPVSLINERKEVLASGEREITVAPFLPAMVSDDRSESREIVREFVALYVCSMGDYYHKLVSSYGFREEADRAKKLWRDNRAKAIKSISDELIDLVSVSGSPDEGRESLRAFAENSDLPILMFPYNASKEQTVFAMKALAP
ncbi:MAG: LLM class flavin-dependent oxidoreductase [Candidatus Dadabacteria bacterium]|nr:LLM class flavin-dependent oxidoreductase [Candidatus Dadabacteria bacterium]MYA48505.1 LLM class flavin-dependent oxidoreductase [Candidatus Dadabacteria bacterium]MYF47596.1 LLM class flavin-dependent oxidoreductase [Candidatus Dadabacteria bacterium]MYG82517.1 LLM class flavin-dependent oxidoreductase [Candidatus Dadabacteria bacterium]MYK49987.1 LLM class flavin-dependent oxidoreductase [Candidatus Dadabacteria bacterium]